MKSRVLLVLVLNIFDEMMTQNTIPAPIEQETPATHSNQQRSLGLAVYMYSVSRRWWCQLSTTKKKKTKPLLPYLEIMLKRRRRKPNRREHKRKMRYKKRIEWMVSRKTLFLFLPHFSFVVWLLVVDIIQQWVVHHLLWLTLVDDPALLKKRRKEIQ